MITGQDENAVFTEYEPSTTPEYQYPISLIYHDRYDKKFELFRNETGKFEKILKISREVTPFTLKKKELAHKKIGIVDESVRVKYFPHKHLPFYNENSLIEENYELEYSAKDIEEKLIKTYCISELFKEDSIITITTDSGEISFPGTEIKFISSFSKEYIPSTLILDVTKEFLNIIINYKDYTYDNGFMSKRTKTRKMMLNMKTGITNYFAEGSDAFTNATTGEIGNDILNILQGSALDKVIEIISDYNEETNKIKPECIKLKTSAETVKSYNFNPYCNLMYLYKPFFNTRFRNYFKRTDSFETQMETFCNLIKIQNSSDLIDLMINNKYDVFLAKCLYEKAEMKNINNIKAIINTLHEMEDKTREFFYFNNKYQGDFTDYYSVKNLYNEKYKENQRENLCKYIKTSIPYTNEDEFTTMFVRSFKQHNKYWLRSLHQIATLIDLKDYSRELLRKACSYGLNKIQSDAIDLAYDKAILKNKFILYSASETALETNIDGFLFKLPLETYEIKSLANEFHSDNLNSLVIDIARRIKTVIFMKDDHGQCVGYLEIRNKLLIDVKTIKSIRHDDDEILAVMKKWCTTNDIRLYNCSAFQDNKLKISF